MSRSASASFATWPATARTNDDFPHPDGPTTNSTAASTRSAGDRSSVVDRVGEAWLTANGRTYLPTESSPGAPEGHRLKDKITSLVTTSTTTPADMLVVTNLYTYDVLPGP